MNKGEQTRQEIIRKAAPLFNQQGYDGTALSDLMLVTGLEKGGIYRHFGSKEELAGEVFEYAWNLALDTRFEGIDEIPDAVDRLCQFLRNFRERRAGLVAGGCPLLNTAIESDDGNPRLRSKAREALRSWQERLRLIVKEGQKKNEIRSHVAASDLATLIVATLEGSLMVSCLLRKDAPLKLACRHLTEYLETEVRVRKLKSGARRR
jgi:TetR/AcrR family transcriptional regulator, transcriptional repressor for nem operon